MSQRSSRIPLRQEVEGFVNPINATGIYGGVEAMSIEIHPQYSANVIKLELGKGFTQEQLESLYNQLDGYYVYPYIGKFNLQGALFFAEGGYAKRVRDCNGRESWELHEAPTKPPNEINE